MSKSIERRLAVQLQTIEMTHNTPKKPGFYWYADEECGEHTPTILKVERDSNGALWATDEEFGFKVQKSKTEWWARVPDPSIGGERIEPGSW